MAKTHVLRRTQLINATLAQTWKFFSDPANLATLTPANMHFNIISQPDDRSVYAGQIIEYKVKPLSGITVYWMTEITHVEKEKFFADEQRFGPFRFWHHQHHFEQTAGGVMMTDIVHYRIGFSFFGAIAHRLLVKKRLAKIFDFRTEVVSKTDFGRQPEITDNS